MSSKAFCCLKKGLKNGCLCVVFFYQSFDSCVVEVALLFDPFFSRSPFLLSFPSSSIVIK